MRRKVLGIFCVLALFFLSSGAAHGISVIAKPNKGLPQQIQLYDYTTALIIGIDRYSNLGTEHHLSYAVKDAKGVEEVLRENYQFDEIITLYNEEATRDKIMRVLYGFRSLSPEAGVLVYFAGHGITMSGMIGGKDLGYIVPSDGSLNSSEMYKNISMQQVKSDICVSISAKHVFFIFDACFAGLMLDTRATLIKPSRNVSYLKSITNEQVRQVLTAGAKGQTILDGGPGGHSVFTGRLIQALNNVDDYITAREIGQEIKKQVYGDAAARGHTQRPVDGEIYGTGDFVFVPDLEKRNRDLNAEVHALEADMTRLKQLKEEAARAKDESKQRELERQRLIKEAELKQAQIRKKQKLDALGRQKQATLEIEQQTKHREQQERENEQRLEMLRMQTEKMRQELGVELTGGATIESAVVELKRLKAQRDKIYDEFSVELRKQTQSVAKFYDDKISRLADTSPWDMEFETEADYKTRLALAESKASPVRQEKKHKLAAMRSELTTARDSQIKSLENQMKTLEEKRFTVPASQVSFRFLSYKLKRQMMLGEVIFEEKTSKFLVGIPKQNAREYKHNPDLLVPEVQMHATLNGPWFNKIVFHSPTNNENYTAIFPQPVSDDGRFIAYDNDVVYDTKTGIEWFAGPDKKTDWNEAKKWVEGLSVAGGGWGMPTRNELKALYQKGVGTRNMTSLLKNTGDFVWSGEIILSSAWYFNFSKGYEDRRLRSTSYTGRGFANRSR